MKKAILVKIISDQGILSSKNYGYFTDVENVKEEDSVVVDAGGTLKVAKVVQTEGLSTFQIAKVTKWVVQHIDTAAYDEKVQTQKLVQEIKNELHAAKEQAEEFEIYRILAQNNPKIKSLLSRLGEIDPSMVPQLPAGDEDEKTTIDDLDTTGAR